MCVYSLYSRSVYKTFLLIYFELLLKFISFAFRLLCTLFTHIKFGGEHF